MAHAVYARGSRTSSLAADLGLRGRQGIVGNALLLEPGETCSYDAKGNVNPRQGTLSFWIQPVNWDGRVIGSATLLRFSFRKPGFALTVSKSGSVQAILATLEPPADPSAPKDAGAPRSIPLKASDELRKERWTKIDLTWTPSSLALYINGRLARETSFAPVPIPEQAAEGRIEVTSGKGELRTCIDEIEIFGQPQDPARILGRYQEVAGARSGEELPAAKLVFLPNLQESRLGVLLQFNDWEAQARWAGRADSARARLAVSGPDGLSAKHDLALESLDEPWWIPLAFADGDYHVSVELRDSRSSETLSVQSAFAKPPMPWLGAGAGVTDEVLSPWTPLEYDGDRTVRCWGRSYSFFGPFLSAVENQGKRLLRAPMQLELETSRGVGVFEETERRVIQQAPNRAEFAGKGRFSGLPGEVEWRAWVEYDGLAHATFTLLPPKDGWEATGLRLRAPLLAGVMRYERGRQSAPCAKRIEGTSYGLADFTEFLWFCNESEGFLYFTESEANWVHDQGQEIVAVDAKDDPGFELRLIAKPVRLEKREKRGQARLSGNTAAGKASQSPFFDRPVTYELGFQATPVKPLLRGWRAHHFSGSGGAAAGIGVTDGVYYKSAFGLSGIWDPARPETFKAAMQKRKDFGCQPYYYSCLGVTPDSNPVYNFFAAVWDDPAGPTYGPYTKPGKPKTEYYMRPVEPGDSAYVDYVTWLAEETERQAGPLCLYTDVFQYSRPREGQLNRWSGSVEEDAFGRTVYRYPFLAMRDYAKRVAAIIREHSRPDAPIYWMGHSHSRLILPVHGFCDWFYPGEEYTQLAQRSGNPYYYIDNLPEEQWRTGFSGAMSGVAHIVLPELGRSGIVPKDQLKVDRGPTDAVLAMCAAHDLNVSSPGHLEAIQEWWAMRDRTGVAKDEARFIGWWEATCPVKAETDKSLASVYLVDGRAIIPIANRNAEAADV
ncbi:MAG: DUF6067 family protein, partial [Candidatus Sumerlaeota bacterium]|nr:DUF6067 family protein [Candidatus Sumerlaeota bacterium]